MKAARGLIAAAGLLLAACGGGSLGPVAPPDALTPPTAPAAGAGQPAGELGPQDLADGACGSFFWGMAAPNPFLVFVNETEGVARVFADGEAHGFFFAPGTGPLIVGDAYERRFRDETRGLHFHLTGTATRIVDDGLRIERAVIRRHAPSGGQVVTPLIGLFTCRDGG